MKNVLIVNQTGADTRNFSKYFAAAANGTPLPEEIADLFSVQVITVDGQIRVILDFAD